MNGLKVSTKTNNFDRHTFLAPSHVVATLAVGKFLQLKLLQHNEKSSKICSYRLA